MRFWDLCSILKGSQKKSSLTVDLLPSLQRLLHNNGIVLTAVPVYHRSVVRSLKNAVFMQLSHEDSLNALCNIE